MKHYYDQYKNAGKCPMCGNRADQGHTLCVDCRAATNERTRTRRMRGLCIHCGEPVDSTGKSACVKCLAANKERMAEVRATRKALGLCTLCDSPRRPTSALCDRHAALKYAKYQRRRTRLESKGLCVQCGKTEPKPGSPFCEVCAGSARMHRRNIKLAAFDAYGGPICACCGESTLSFLSLDHINGNGGEHRRSTGTRQCGEVFYRLLKKQGYPSGYQVLCMNCNWGRSQNGGNCPHKVVSSSQ